jgi:hypothetical protein
LPEFRKPIVDTAKVTNAGVCLGFSTELEAEFAGIAGASSCSKLWLGEDVRQDISEARVEGPEYGAA